MDFWQTVVVLFRRWYIALPAFVATLALAAAAYSAVPAQYESRSILVLTTPLTGGTQARDPKLPNTRTNPLMNFDRSLGLTASIVIQEMNSLETARALGLPPGGTSDYQVTNGSTNPELLESGPFLFITGTASSPAEATDIATEVAAMATTVLSERQDALNAPASTHIRVEEVVAPTAGQLLRGNPLRAAAAGMGLGTGASLAAVFGFESLMTHRRRRSRDNRPAFETSARPSPESSTEPDDAGPVCVTARTQPGRQGAPRSPRLVLPRRTGGVGR